MFYNYSIICQEGRERSEREGARKIKGKLLNLCVTYLNGAEQSTETETVLRERDGGRE